MKNLIILICLVASAVLWSPGISYGQSKEEMRARENEKVWVVVNHVKDEVRTEYEQYMKDIFFPLLVNSKNPKTQEQYRKTRWLSPTRQNEDKTWTYVFLVDPVVENGDYTILSLLREGYPEEEAQKLLEQYIAFMSQPMQTPYFLMQTEH